MDQYPYSRVEATLRRFHTVVEVHLTTLTQHKNNIEKFRACRRWKELNKEQVNASRTVQQISSCLREAEKTRQHVIESDLAQFDKAVRPVREKALTVLVDFLQQERATPDECEQTLFSPAPGEDPLSVVPVQPLKLDVPLSVYDDVLTEVDVPAAAEQQQQTAQLQMAEKSPDPEKQKAKASWFTLEKNITDLNEMMRCFASAVRSQQRTVDSIEDHVETSHEHIQQGVQSLSMAAKLKAVMLPVGGAVVGGLVGGPVGLAVGVKLGLAAGVGGGALGFLGGRFMKKKTEESTDVAMKEMNSNLNKPSDTE